MKLTESKNHSEIKELIGILMESSIYFDLTLAERKALLQSLYF
jgi:hypothetical protein